MAVDMEEQPVQAVRKVMPSKHKSLFILLSLYNVVVGLSFLLVKIPFYHLALPGKNITIMDVLDSSDFLCGGLLVAIGVLCWAQRNNAIEPVQQGVFIALTNVAVAFGIHLVGIHSASIVTHQTYRNAFICLGGYQANNTTIVGFQIEGGSIYSKEVFCRYLCYLHLFDSLMIASGVVVIVMEGITAMSMY